ncbi:MAG: response regulator [Desulfobacteraceae bacterium]|nr:MAG: response regulator [Desulfobacteraceae bacterium]
MANILVVDDQPCVRELLSEELAQEGHRVSSVSDTKFIWQYLTDSRPDLVLLDIYLDGCTRWDLLRDIKNRNPDLPVLIFTAYDSFADDQRLSHADGYVIKSFVALDTLKQKVAEILGWKKASHKAHITKTADRAYLRHLARQTAHPYRLPRPKPHT